MNKDIKKRLLEICDTMEEALSEIFVRNNLSLILELQEVIKVIQETLESDGEHADIVIDLKSVCHGLNDYLKEPKDNISYQIQENMRKIYTDINNIEENIDIVFFPYNASMWDALESVYKEAAKDNHVNALVVPIPYYHIENGKVALRYEIHNFPTDIPVVDYREYSLELNRPDIAYIHNPYDDTNLVTRVPEEYYSYNLKKYVKTLVYIPYYAPPEVFDRSHYVLSAYKHVDYIILSKFAHKKNLSNYNDENKLLVLGTPKYDKFGKDEIKIPSQWQKIAGNRKIIFFNIGLIHLLKEREKALDKLEFVLKSATKRHDICLLFRPHPLYESTLEAMAPYLLERYKKIKEKFIKTEMGIYDTLENVSVGASVSAAFLGEASSVERLFEIQGKPKFIVNADICRAATEKDLHTAYTLRVEFTEQRIWYVANHINKLCYIDRDTKEVVEYVDLPGPKSIYSYGDVIVAGDNIIVCPYTGTNTFIVNKHTKEIKTLKMEDSPGHYIKMYLYGENVYFISDMTDNLVKVNLKTWEKKYIDISEINKEDISKGEFRISLAHHLEENLLYIASATCNKIMVLDLKTQKIKTYTVGEEIGYTSLAYRKNNIYLGSASRPYLVKWNPKKNKSKTYKLKENGHQGDFVANMSLYGDDIFLFFYREAGAYKFSPLNESLSDAKDLLDLDFSIDPGYYYFGDFGYVENVNGQLAVLYNRNMCLHVLGDKLEKYMLRTNVAVSPEYNPLGDLLNYEVGETLLNSLEGFFDYVHQDEQKEQRKINYVQKITDITPGESGSLIHKTILSKHRSQR